MGKKKHRKARDTSTALVAPELPSSGDGSVLTPVAEIRRRARKHLEQGAVTAGYQADRGRVLARLDAALAAQEFLQHANEEQGHADQIAARITQLGGAPDLNPARLLERSHSEYVEGKSLHDMIREDLVAERIAIDSYAEMIRYIGDGDPTTRRMLEAILAMEEEHADDLVGMLATLGRPR